MGYIVNIQSYPSTPPELQDKRQLENFFDSKQTFTADSFHEERFNLKVLD